MEVRCFSSLEEITFLRDEINALNFASLRPDPFSTFEFFKHFLYYEKFLPENENLNLWFLTAFNDGRLIGYMPLKQVFHKILGMQTSKIDFLVTHDADRPQLIARPELALAVSEMFYSYLMNRRREWSFLEFRQQDTTSPLFPPPTKIKLTGYWVGQWPSLDNGTIPIRWNSLEAYFRSFSTKFRSNVSRQMRSLVAAGELEYFVSSDPETTPPLFELYRTIEPRSWKSQASQAIGRHPQWVEYVKGLLNAHQPMRISIHLLLLNGIPIAGLITSAFGQGLYALHIMYDASLHRLGPGSAVLLLSMRQAIGGGYTFFNLLAGFGYYKVRWQAQMTETKNTQIYRIGTPFFWRRMLGNLKRRMFPITTPQQSDILFNPARRMVVENTRELVENNPFMPQLTSKERESIATLIVHVRQGRGEYLSSSQLVALMPFPIQHSTSTKQSMQNSQATSSPRRRSLST